MNKLPSIGAFFGGFISVITDPFHLVEIFLYAGVGAAAGEIVKRLFQKKWPTKKD